jgi:8-oxo-dGTP diphosphatase
LTHQNNPSNDFIHVVAGLIWQPHSTENLLISKRQTGKHLEGFWEFPGGKMEVGETAIEALRRELREELDIIALKVDPYQQVLHRYADQNILLDVWEVKSFQGSVVAREGQECKWVAVDQLFRYRFPDADLPVLETIVSSALAKKEHLA